MNKKGFKRTLSAIMLLMMLAPIFVSTHAAARSYFESQKQMEVIKDAEVEKENKKVNEQ